MGLGLASNNFANISAACLILKTEVFLKLSSLDVYGNSQVVVVEAIAGQTALNNILLQAPWHRVLELKGSFQPFGNAHIIRPNNSVADRTAKEAELLPQDAYMRHWFIMPKMRVRFGRSSHSVYFLLIAAFLKAAYKGFYRLFQPVLMVFLLGYKSEVFLWILAHSFGLADISFFCSEDVAW